MTDAALPGPGTLEAVRTLASSGFLKAVGQFQRRHGDTFRVRLGPRRMVFALHPDAVQQITVTNRRSWDKQRSYDGVRRYLTGRGLVASTGDLWKRQRKLMAPFFTPRGVRAYAETMLRETLRTVERWDPLADTGEVVDMAEEMMRLTASIIVRAMFSTDAEDDIVRLKADIGLMIGYTNDRAASPVPDTWPTRKNRAYAAARARVHAYIGALIARRRSLPGDEWPDDLLTRLMRARDADTGAAMDSDLLRDESITTFFAGHETTARTMAAAWYLLATHPDVEARLHAELDAVLGDGLPGVEALYELPYALRVIKEVLRLYPPAPFYVRDAVAPDTIGGHPLPTGTAVLLSPYWTHRHPDFWPDAERFDPDRWAPEAERERHPGAYHPFASGERVCIGNHFSLLEGQVLLAVLGRRFAPRMASADAPTWAMRGVLEPVGGLPMRIVRR